MNALMNCTEISYIPVDSILPNPNQPRKFFDVAQLNELAQSIREYGVMQPISVRKNGSFYELVAGERRLRASKLAGLSVIPAIVSEIAQKESAILALIENLLRQDLNFIEEAEGLSNLINDFSFTQEELAEKIGKSQSTIANKLRILRLSKNVQNYLLSNGLTERHARALLRLKEEKHQMEILHKVVAQGLTVKKTEEYIEAYIRKEKEEPKKMKNLKARRLIKDIRLFTNSIKQAVDIMNASGVETIYNINKADGYYEISILVSAETKEDTNE